ncbi:uncharacterized protein LOC141931602 [Strix aluco]|uniref:uncharacterized protein LOC141931602 n=1 Tax=Strix aluco TaxID=111821 RepID=UPI003DA22673
MDSYFPTTSTPCTAFLDLLVCIQRAAVKIVVLANGLDHIIPPRAPPWHPLFSAPFVDSSSSLSQPFIIHLSSTHHLPCNRGCLRRPFPTSPFMLSPAPLHTWEKQPLSICKATPSPSLKLFVTTEAFRAELLCSAHRLLAVPPCSLPLPGLPAPSRCFFTPARTAPSSWALGLYSTQQNMLLTQWWEPRNQLSHVWASDSRDGLLLDLQVLNLGTARYQFTLGSVCCPSWAAANWDKPKCKVKPDFGAGGAVVSVSHGGRSHRRSRNHSSSSMTPPVTGWGGVEQPLQWPFVTGPLTTGGGLRPGRTRPGGSDRRCPAPGTWSAPPGAGGDGIGTPSPPDPEEGVASSGRYRPGAPLLHFGGARPGPAGGGRVRSSVSLEEIRPRARPCQAGRDGSHTQGVSSPTKGRRSPQSPARPLPRPCRIRPPAPGPGWAPRAGAPPGGGGGRSGRGRARLPPAGRVASAAGTEHARGSRGGGGAS